MSHFLLTGPKVLGRIEIGLKLRPDVKVLRVGLGDKLGLKSDGDTQCLNDLVGDGDDGAEVIEKFKCSGSYTLDLPYIPPGCLPNCPSSVFVGESIMIDKSSQDCDICIAECISLS